MTVEVDRGLGYAMDHAMASGERTGGGAFQRLPHGELESWLAGDSRAVESAGLPSTGGSRGQGRAKCQ